MIFLVRIRVLPKLLQTCRVFLSFFPRTKNTPGKICLPKKTCISLDKILVGRVKPSLLLRLFQVSWCFLWEKTEKLREKKHKTPRSSCAKRVPLVNGRFFAQKDNLGIQWFETCFKNMFMSCLCHFNLNIRVTIMATGKKVSLSSSDAAMCTTCKKNSPNLQIQNHQQNYATRGMNGESTRKVCRKSNATTALAGPKSERLSIGTRKLIDNWALRKSQNVSKSSNLMIFSWNIEYNPATSTTETLKTEPPNGHPICSEANKLRFRTNCCVEHAASHLW